MRDLTQVESQECFYRQQDFNKGEGTRFRWTAERLLTTLYYMLDEDQSSSTEFSGIYLVAFGTYCQRSRRRDANFLLNDFLEFESAGGDEAIVAGIGSGEGCFCIV